MTPPLTEAEKAFDDFITARREQGRSTYGQGLDHQDKRWSWERMALEELADACQYLIAETLRLRGLLAEARERVGYCPCGSDACAPAEAVVARIDAELAPRTPEGGC
jgi:hypothetical protein